MLKWKRGAIVLLFSLVLLSSVVYASTPTGIEQVDAIINVVFNLNDELGLKLVFALLVFTLLFGVSEFVFRGWAKGIRFLLTVTMSIMTVTFIPHRLLASISKTYGVIFVFVMIGVPVLGAIYFLFAVLTEKNKHTYAIKAAICGVLWYVLGALANDVKGIFGAAWTIGSSLLGGFEKFSVVVSSFFLIMMIYYVVKVLSAHHEESPEDFQAIGRRAGAFAGLLGRTRPGNWLKNMVMAEKSFTVQELKSISEIRRQIMEIVAILTAGMNELVVRFRAGGVAQEQFRTESEEINRTVNERITHVIRKLEDIKRDARKVYQLARKSRRYSGKETTIAALEEDISNKVGELEGVLDAFETLDIRAKVRDRAHVTFRENALARLNEIYTELGSLMAEIQSTEKETEAAALPTRL